MKLKLPERRRYIRIEVPLKVTVKGSGWQEETFTKNISPMGMRFQLGRKVESLQSLDMSALLPPSDEAINMRGKVIWQERSSIEDNSPYDVGVEIISIEENGKMVLLKYLCDLLYDSSYNLHK